MTAAPTPPTTPASVAERYRALENRVELAAARAGRDRREIHLLGASKRQPLDRLRQAYEAGLRLFGENQVQEASEHAAALSATGAAADIDWHLIGPLQSNKARPATQLFSTIQSIDRMKIARALNREAGRQGRALAGFLEINLGAEASKHGFAPRDLFDRVEQDNLGELAELEHLQIVGLMAIPPFDPIAENSRPHFRRLRELRDELFARTPWSHRPGYLSMGMSGDFEVAVEEGATHIRVGSALFGTREAKA